jgi:4-hydroxy-tetrahydrodipicolinate synthase
MSEIIGAMTALITPMKDDKLDTQTYQKLILRQIKHGIDVVVPVGTTGESATLSHNEHKQCIEIAIDTCKNTNTRVLAGAGSNSTKEATELAKFAESAGADGVLAVTPYYNKPTQEGLYEHYKTIASNINIPLLTYNVPGRTSVDLLADTVIKLVENVDNIYGVKEATGSIERAVEILAKNPSVVVISGDDAINYPLMANYAKGCISVTSNLLPDKISTLIHTGLAGQFDTSKAINDELYNINKALFVESNPIPIKTAMHIAGLLPSLEFRLPLTKASSKTIKLLERVMSEYDILD